MTVIERSALLSHSAEQIFDLVADIERYPEFLEGCVGADILEREGDTVTASLRLSKAGISHGFTTCNTLQRPQRMTLTLVEGPLITSKVSGSSERSVTAPVKRLCDWSLTWPAVSPERRWESSLTASPWISSMPLFAGRVSSWGKPHE